MSLPELAGIAAVLGFGATVQSAIGFGMGLVSIPLLVWLGHPLPHAVALVIGASLFQTAYGTWLMRRHVVWRRTFVLGAFQAVGALAGIAGMALLVGTSDATVKQGVGAMVLAALLAQLAFRPAPRERLPFVWLGVAGLLAGFFGGLVGMGGPPLVFYALAHRWERDVTRAFLWSQFCLAMPVVTALLSAQFGTGVLRFVGIGASMVPVLFVGVRLGLYLTRHWSPEVLRRAGLAMLFAIALMSLVRPLL
ncbi:MAG: sulfite exporter TauE/SafE family protein [Myxococcota bacterium]